jgi:hypothetical protein
MKSVDNQTPYVIFWCGQFCRRKGCRTEQWGRTHTARKQVSPRIKSRIWLLLPQPPCMALPAGRILAQSTPLTWWLYFFLTSFLCWGPFYYFTGEKGYHLHNKTQKWLSLPHKLALKLPGPRPWHWGGRVEAEPRSTPRVCSCSFPTPLSSPVFIPRTTETLSHLLISQSDLEGAEAWHQITLKPTARGNSFFFSPVLFQLN